MVGSAPGGRGTVAGLPPLWACGLPEFRSTANRPGWALLNVDGRVTTAPTTAERRLAALALGLFLQDRPGAELVRAEVNRRILPSQTGYLYLRFRVPDGEEEFWACWGARDEIDRRRGQIRVRLPE